MDDVRYAYHNPDTGLIYFFNKIITLTKFLYIVV